MLRLSPIDKTTYAAYIGFFTVYIVLNITSAIPQRPAWCMQFPMMCSILAIYLLMWMPAFVRIIIAKNKIGKAAE